MALIFLFKKTIHSPIHHLQCQHCLLDCLLHSLHFFKMENPLFTPHLGGLFNLWNNAVCQMNYLVSTAGRVRSTSILEKVHKAFFNYFQFHAMANTSDEIVLARMMTTLDLEYERVLHYHDEGTRVTTIMGFQLTSQD